MILAAMLALALVQEPQEWKLELERLKARLAASEAEVESLRKRVRETAPAPALPEGWRNVTPSQPTPLVPALPKARTKEEQIRAAEEARRAAEALARENKKDREEFLKATGRATPPDEPVRDAARRLEEVLKAPSWAPRTGSPPPVECVVSAVANEIGLVVISAGRDRGILEKDEFTIYRGGDFVAKGVVDRADRQWSAAKITLKKIDPRVGDSVSNLIFVTPPAGAAVAAPPADELKALRKELDEVRKQVRTLSDTLVPAWQGPGLALEEAPEELRAHLGIARGVLVRRVREGSAAEKAGLKANDLIPDLSEAELLDALQKPAPIRILRQGRELKIGR